MAMAEALARWLQLREPSDAAARSTAVTQALADAVHTRDTVRVLDLGTGTGSNVRYLVPFLPRRQHWVIADRDPALLALVTARMAPWASTHGLEVRSRPGGCTIEGASLHCDIETRAADICRLDEALFEGSDVVTASALLDLASESWLRTLATRCREGGAAALFGLTYNGWSTCSPAEPEDDAIRDLMNRHQQTDKGLGGAAAGPEAAALAPRCFRDAGFDVRTAPTHWHLDATHSDMQRILVHGWSEVAIELAPGDAAAVADWRRRRLDHIDAGRSRIAVGHVDMAAWLAA
jgi:SAM-dependent methyltransferase